MLIKEKFDEFDGHEWFNVYSDTEGKMVLQEETGEIYGCVSMRDDDPHTYIECDDPNYVAEDQAEDSENEHEGLEI